MIEKYVPSSAKIGDPVHRFFQHAQQINGGRMDRYAAVAGTGLPLGYHDASRLALWRYAQNYTLADRFFQATFGNTTINHLWLV